MDLNRTGALVAILLTAAIAAPQAAEAQISLEVRGSLQRPIDDFNDRANGDVGFAGDVFFHVNRSLSLYGGYGLERFGCSGCSSQDGLTSKGFEAGAKLMAGSGRGGVLPWIRVGAVLHELEVDDGALQATSDRKVGLQASAGLDIPLGDVLSFSPALRYQAYRAEFPLVNDALVALMDVRFLTLDFGLHIHPGT